MIFFKLQNCRLGSRDRGIYIYRRLVDIPYGDLDCCTHRILTIEQGDVLLIDIIAIAIQRVFLVKRPLRWIECDNCRVRCNRHNEKSPVSGRVIRDGQRFTVRIGNG